MKKMTITMISVMIVQVTSSGVWWVGPCVNSACLDRWRYFHAKTTSSTVTSAKKK